MKQVTITLSGTNGPVTAKIQAYYTAHYAVAFDDDRQSWGWTIRPDVIEAIKRGNWDDGSLEYNAGDRPYGLDKEAAIAHAQGALEE